MRRRAAWWIPASGYGLLVAFALPLVVGLRTLYLRDLFNFHYMVKVVQAKAMAEGYLPLVDLLRAGGQPLVGNLNSVPLYPDNLLYLAASPMWALNAHMWIHLLAAPAACYWLAREWGLSREASWTAAFLYATSGFFLSQLNLYNMIAPVALAPAFVAACLSLTAGRRQGLSVVAVAVLWCLTVLGGEPLVALIALLAGASACLARGGVDRRGWLRLFGALACGSLLAAPQIVELLRISPSSYRVGVGFDHASRLIGSWDPRTAIEWLVPLFFGEPGFGYWGAEVLRGQHPLFYSLYPGLLALILLASAGRPRQRLEVWCWASIGVGGFVALGGWNPAMFLILQLPVASSLRYPVKWFLLVALAAALLGGVALDRLRAGGGRRAMWVVMTIAVVLGVLWLVVSLRPAAAVALVGGALTPQRIVAEVARWRGLLLLSLLLLAAYATLLPRLRTARWPVMALVTVHVASQLFLLRSLAGSDEVAAYRGLPAAAAYVSAGERVVQTCALDFACGAGNPADFPDGRPLWLQRRTWHELHPWAGAGYGIPYSFNASPEGLDSFLPSAAGEGLATLDDAELIRVLRASSVDVLLINRELGDETAGGVSLRGEVETLGSRLWVYGLRDSAAPARLVGRVRSGDLSTVLRAMASPDFDPVAEVYLPGRPEGLRDDRPGDVRELAAEGREAWSYQVDSPDGGLLVLDRSFLPIYAAEVDGEPVQTLLVNLGQMAIEVPAGRHRADVRVDRSSFVRSSWGAALGLLALAALAMVVARDPASSPRTGAGRVEDDTESA